MTRGKSIRSVMENKSLKNKLTIVVLGRSGSGKGTQVKFILQRLGRGAYHLETGRFIREVVKRKKNATTKIVKEITERGELTPPWFAAFTWLKKIIEDGQADKHLVADGSPRSLWEAELYDNVIKVHGRILPLCIYIEVSLKEATKRLLLRGRADDTSSAIRNRMTFFKRDVLPAIRYFKNRGRLIKVNGNLSPDIVWREIDQAFAKRLGEKWPNR